MRRFLTGAAVVLAGSAVATPAQAATVQPSALALPSVGYATSAYGTYIAGALAGSGITAGTTAPSGVGCTTTAGLTNTNNVAAANLKAVTTGAVTSTSQSLGTTTSRTAKSTNSVAGLNLLSGLITASAVSSTTTSTVTSTGTASGTNTSNLVGLKIGGVPISASTPANTTLPLTLAGTTIGRVVINEQAKTTTGGLVSGTTRALDVTLTSAALGLGAGARIVVANSAAALNGVPAGMAGGDAYALKSTLANGTAATSPLAYAGAPCEGGTGSNAAAAGGIPSVTSLGAATSTTKSTTNPTLTSTATNTIASASVLGGLISASNIKASTTTTRASKTATPVSTDNSTFGTLKLAGFPLITPVVAPNTSLNVAGLGTVTFHKVTRTTTGIKVTMINIVLSKALGTLPTGSTIEIGVSETSAK